MRGQATATPWSTSGVLEIYMKCGKALVELQWPNGRTAILNIAHDHVGTSLIIADQYEQIVKWSS